MPCHLPRAELKPSQELLPDVSTRELASPSPPAFSSPVASPLPTYMPQTLIEGFSYARQESVWTQLHFLCRTLRSGHPSYLICQIGVSGNRASPRSGIPVLWSHWARTAPMGSLSLTLYVAQALASASSGSPQEVCPSRPAAPALTVLAMPPARPLHPATGVHSQEEVGGGEEASPAYVALQMRVPARSTRCPSQQQPDQAQPEAAAHPDLCPPARRGPAARSGAGLGARLSNGRGGGGDTDLGNTHIYTLECVSCQPVAVTPGCRCGSGEGDTRTSSQRNRN